MGCYPLQIPPQGLLNQGRGLLQGLHLPLFWTSDVRSQKKGGCGNRRLIHIHGSRHSAQFCVMLVCWWCDMALSSFIFPSQWIIRGSAIGNWRFACTSLGRLSRHGASRLIRVMHRPSSSRCILADNASQSIALSNPAARAALLELGWM